jgi:hypothetical protein
MPGDGVRSPASMAAQQNIAITHPVAPHPQPTRMASDMSLNSSGNPARASSTTLHIDALLQAGRARAEAEAQGTNAAKVDYGRPQSIGSEYTLPHAKSLADLLALDPPPLPEMDGQLRRPPLNTLNSYMSYRSDQTNEPSMSDEGGEETNDQALLEKRQRIGRQKSLVFAINAAEQRALEAMEDLDVGDGSPHDHRTLSPGNHSVQGHFKPDGTPYEHAVYEMGHMPPVPDMPVHASTGKTLRVRNTTPEDEDDDDTIEAGDQIILLDLVRDQLPEIRSSSPLDLTMNDGGAYDYAPEAPTTDFNPRSPNPEQGDDSLRARYADLDPYAGMSHEQMAFQSGNRYNSVAISEVESEVGQVHGAVKRNLSVRTPARLVPSEDMEHEMEANRSTASLQPDTRHYNAARQPSPLRNVQQLPHDAGASRPLPSSPSRRYIDHSQYQEPGGLSPRSQPRLQMPSQGNASSHERAPAQSHLRRPMSSHSRYGTAEDESPGLAPSVASDSASSEGHLESPPHSAVPTDVSIIPSTNLAAASGSTTEKGLDTALNWVPGDNVNQQVYLQNQASYSDCRLPETPKATTTSLDALSSDSHSAPGSPQTVESMLPSVRTKIEQLNTREEALRKFSVTGALSPSTPRASISSNPRNSLSIDPRQSIISTTLPLVTSPVSTSGRYTPQAMSPTSPSSIPAHLLADQSPSKRRSYTAALGPRTARTMSNESSSTMHSRNPSTHKVGNTTFLTKRSFAQSRHIPPSSNTIASPSHPDSAMTSPQYSYQTALDAQQSPQGKRPERTLSISSTSTSATSIEAALIRRPGGPRGPATPTKKGSLRHEPIHTLGYYGHVTEEDDSEGLV